MNPYSTLEDRASSTSSAMESDFITKMDLLSTKFYSMSNEDAAALEALYEKYK